MNSLRFLLVHRNPKQSDEIAALLARENHSVLPTPGLKEAADALLVERFDAVLMEPDFRSDGLVEFSAELRRIERAQRSAARVPVIALANDHDVVPEPGLDAILPEPLDAAVLTATVTQLARAVGTSREGHTDSEHQAETILDPEKFREQVGYDPELMCEIIDLFLSERKHQEPEMQEALAAGDLDLLSRIAHTIKGSLGSLHALKARTHAQDLEYAARSGDEDACWQLLAALEADLAELEPELVALRSR